MFWNRKRSDETKWWWAALAAYLVMLVINALAGSTTILGGVNTAEVSDSNPNLFAPAGLTFSIWAVIYLLLGLFFVRVFNLWRIKKSSFDQQSRSQVVRLFTYSSIVNVAWLFAWQYEYLGLSVILMIALLVVLGKIVELLRNTTMPLGEYAVTKLPFSVYFGWISVATVANITTWLVSIGWDGFGIREGVWIVAILIVAAVIGLIAGLRNRDAAYISVFVWAFAGILYKHLSGTGFDGAYPTTIVTLTILLAVLLSTLVPMYQSIVRDRVA